MLQDWSYDEEESGRSETLVKAIEKIEVLEKQLNIAIRWLKYYADEDNWTSHNDSSSDIWCGFGFDGYSRAQTALEEIKNVAK